MTTAQDLDSDRSLQIETVVPRCNPGFKDVTGGQAYTWACAFHCPGGRYSTANCQCACLSDEQAERYASQGIEVQSGPVSVPSRNPTEILVPQPPDPTHAPSDPVVQMPIGAASESGDMRGPPRSSNFLAASSGDSAGSLLAATRGDPDSSSSSSSGGVHFVAMAGAVLLIGASLAMVGVAFRHACFKNFSADQNQDQHKTGPKPKPPRGPLPVRPTGPVVEAPKLPQVPQVPSDSLAKLRPAAPRKPSKIRPSLESMSTSAGTVPQDSGLTQAEPVRMEKLSARDLTSVPGANGVQERPSKDELR